MKCLTTQSPRGEMVNTTDLKSSVILPKNPTKPSNTRLPRLEMPEVRDGILHFKRSKIVAVFFAAYFLGNALTVRACL